MDFVVLTSFGFVCFRGFFDESSTATADLDAVAGQQARIGHFAGLNVFQDVLGWDEPAIRALPRDDNFHF